MPDPLESLVNLGEVATVASAAHDALAAAHRRPAALRKPDQIVAESVLRSARLSTLMEGEAAPVDGEPEGLFAHVISVYAQLAPAKIQDSAARVRRSPAHVLARMDVAAGGPGAPVDAPAARRVQALGRLLAPDAGAHEMVLPQVVHAEIAAYELFGPRSGIIARAASRLVAVASGADPRGLAVPEVYYHRHIKEYREVLAAWRTDLDGVRHGLEFMLRAWKAGAEEAESIIASV